MNAKELMIGDWVQIKHGRKLQLELDQFFAQGKHEFEGTPIDYFAGFEPIPLTPEILENNGFRKEEFEYGEVGWFPKEGCTYLTQYPKQNPMFALEGTDIELEYVHQLQHALRLCGLTELADNFKV